MLEQHARVIQGSGLNVFVETIEPEGCGVCAGQGCASRRIAELFQQVPRQYQVESQLNLSSGDKVIIGVPDGWVLRGALYLYGMPLLLILGGTFSPYLHRHANAWFGHTDHARQIARVLNPFAAKFEDHVAGL